MKMRKHKWIEVTHGCSNEFTRIGFRHSDYTVREIRLSDPQRAVRVSSVLNYAVLSGRLRVADVAVANIVVQVVFVPTGRTK